MMTATAHWPIAWIGRPGDLSRQTADATKRSTSIPADVRRLGCTISAIANF